MRMSEKVFYDMCEQGRIEEELMEARKKELPAVLSQTCWLLCAESERLLKRFQNNLDRCTLEWIHGSTKSEETHIKNTKSFLKGYFNAVRKNYETTIALFDKLEESLSNE